MKKTRWMLVATLILILSGLSFGLIGTYSRFAVRAEGPSLPTAINYLPQNAEVVGYVSISKLIYSPAYQEFEKEHGNEFAAHLQEFINETGLDPRRDLDSVVFAALPGTGHETGVAIVSAANYNREKITNLILTKGRAGTASYNGHTLYTNPKKRDGDNTQEVAAFLDGSNLVFGQLEAVQQTIDVLDRKGQSVISNVVINQLLSHVRTDGTFWVISTNTNFINHLPTKGAPDQIKQSIPQIQNFILEGDLGNMVTASLRSQCANEEAAKNLSDFARGLVALGKMFTAQRPELAGILADVRVSQDATEKTLVTVEISVPFEDLKKLKKMETRQGTSSAIKAF